MEYAKLVAEYLFTEREQERIKKLVYKARSKAEVSLRIQLDKAYRDHNPEPDKYVTKVLQFKPTLWDTLRGKKQDVVEVKEENNDWNTWKIKLYHLTMAKDIETLIKNAKDYLEPEAIQDIAGDYLKLKSKKERLETRLNELHDVLKMEFDVDE